MSYFEMNLWIPISGVVALSIALLSGLIWGAGFKANFLYALLARIPVIAVIYLDRALEWNTHYARFPEGSPNADRSPMDAAMWMSVGQLVMWVPFTIILGGLFAAIGAMAGGKR